MENNSNKGKRGYHPIKDGYKPMEKGYNPSSGNLDVSNPPGGTENAGNQANSNNQQPSTGEE